MINPPRLQIKIDDNIEYNKSSYITDKYNAYDSSKQFSKVVGDQRKQQSFNTNQNVFFQGLPFILDKINNEKNNNTLIKN